MNNHKDGWNKRNPDYRRKWRENNKERIKEYYIKKKD